MEDLIEQLRELPDEWGFLPCGKNKRPYGTFAQDWSNKPQSKNTVIDEIKSGRCVAVGVLSGRQSGGLLMVDHDGLGATKELKEIGVEKLKDLPPSWACTSSRNARLQIIYKVPERYWDHIKTTKLKKLKITDDEGNIEQLELRWDGCQSIVIGQHPQTQGYRWLKGRSPADLPIAEAPSVLLQVMMKKHKVDNVVRLNKSFDLPSNPPEKSDVERARSYLKALDSSRADDYDDWLQVGMALHSVGDNSLLADWDNWSAQSAKWEAGICDRKWESFELGNTNLGTLGHFAKQDGWRSNRTPVRRSPNNRRQNNQDNSSNESGGQIQPRKLETLELLNLLREQRAYRQIRFNVFTQQIEINEKPMDGVERFYLNLAESGYKVPKDLAVDCLVQVAREQEFDPVKEYLEYVSTNVEPTYIDALATTYLRPEDKPCSLYDEMLKRTLIGAVKRIYEPGAKHDTSCILIGCQGARKSTFWAVLGGTFFSDSLKDIGNKDDLMILARSWIMEMSELDHITSRKQAGQVKAFLSQSTDIYRVPYGKNTEVFPRRGIIVGSTNRDNFLMDETGNRRFWCIPVTKNINDPIDTPNLLLERDGIWSAATRMYKEGVTNFLPSDLELQVEEQNTDYLVASPWQKAIAEWLTMNPFETITTEGLLAQVIQKPLDRQTKADQMQIADVLKRLGYEKRRIRVDGSRQSVWHKL